MQPQSSAFSVIPLLGTLLTIIPPVAARPPKEEQPFQTAVFTSGTEGYHTYRIPALLVTKKGTLLAFCEGRKTGRGDHGDVDLVLKSSTDLGKTWSGLKLIHEEGDTAKITIGNPCPVIDQDTGIIWLPFCRDNKDVFITHSEDDGLTWSKPRDITKDVTKPDWGWYATGPGVGIQIRQGKHKGRLVVPCDHSETQDAKPPKYSHVIFSDDHGKTWKLGGTVAPHTNECQVVERADGTLILNMRNYWGTHGNKPELGGMRAISRSKDGGETWSEPEFDKTLIEPICQASFLRYGLLNEDGKDPLLFANPASKKSRERLTVRLSYDEGKTWPVSKLIHEGSAAYSCLTVLPDKNIGLVYERDDYKRIVFTAFSLKWLTGKDD